MARLVIPNLGNYTIAMGTAVKALGVEPWVSTATTKDALKIGLDAGPELACLPFKAHLGHFMAAAEAGVEYGVMVNSAGTCRLRYYRYIMQDILDDLGIKIHVFGLGYDGIKPPMIRFFDPDDIPFFRAAAHALLQVKVIDALEMLAWKTRAVEQRKGDTSALMRRCLGELERCHTARDTLALRRKIPRLFASVPILSGKAPLRIGLIGEVSALRDTQLNQNIEHMLGGLGVEVQNFFLLGAELGNIFLFGFGSKNSRRRLSKIARGYLGHGVGGHALDSVAHAISCARHGFDGLVHVCPFGCMPEISVRPILSRISSDLDIPILECSFDEHTSAVGLSTRLEAFVDILRERRHKGERMIVP